MGILFAYDHMVLVYDQLTILHKNGKLNTYQKMTNFESLKGEEQIL